MAGDSSAVDLNLMLARPAQKYESYALSYVPYGLSGLSSCSPLIPILPSFLFWPSPHDVAARPIHFLGGVASTALHFLF